jgi:D-sedoheptulose 7-phosphate isomerase
MSEVGSSSSEVVAAHLAEHRNVLDAVTNALVPEIERLAELVLRTVRDGGTLYFCGNGGSAAEAQHLAAEYVVRFRRERRPIAALALTTDTSVLTAGGNDYGFDSVFERQVRALARPGDLLLVHSTSGESENLVRAVEAARSRDVSVAGLLAGGGGRLAGLVDVGVVVPTDSTARAQELHLTIGHIVCEIVDQAMAE